MTRVTFKTRALNCGLQQGEPAYGRGEERNEHKGGGESLEKQGKKKEGAESDNGVCVCVCVMKGSV